jgi:hypothetical protein
MTFKDKVGKADATSTHGDKPSRCTGTDKRTLLKFSISANAQNSDLEMLLQQIQRTELALIEIRVADKALRQGDDLTLRRMNFSQARIDDLRSRSAVFSLRKHYEPRIKTTLRTWHKFLGKCLLEQTVV